MIICKRFLAVHESPNLMMIYTISNDPKTKIAQLRFNKGANNLLFELNNESKLILYRITAIKGFSVQSIEVFVNIFHFFLYVPT